MELKELTIKDRGSITNLFMSVFTNEPWNDDWSDHAQLDAYIHDLIGQDNSLTLGYCDGNHIVALAMGHIKHWFAGTEYNIDELCVDREMQGKGIGSIFLGEIERFLSTHGITRIFLQTDRDMPAYAFYIHRGFQELERHVSFVKGLTDTNITK